MLDSQSTPNTEPVIKPLVERPPIATKAVVGVLVFIFILGSGTGYMLANLRSSSQTSTAGTNTIEKVQSDTKAGVLDKKTFSDTATGILREGGFEGEGSHHLERGAKDQTAYLTSSTFDLAPYVGKKVEVWGQTNTGQKTGWLMDVGYIEIVK
ncbi:hypothetical protein KBB12_04390 [Candidatus Woesebacteria bacterium]|nr:hypothetical protein [Candidatus Woesebacteria bacterium]